MPGFINYQKKYKQLTKHKASLKIANSKYTSQEQRTAAAQQFTDNEKKETDKVTKKPAPPPPPPVAPTGMTRITL